MTSRLQSNDRKQRAAACKRLDRGERPESVATAFKVSVATLYRWRRELDQPTATEELERRKDQARRLAKRKRASEVAEQLGVSERTVRRWLAEGA